MSTTPGCNDAEQLAADLDAAASRSFAEWNHTLRQHLDDEVEIRHEPPVAALDGWRDREATTEYLLAELTSFPRAFADDFRTTVTSTVEGPSAIVMEIAYAGTLRVAEPRHVDVGFSLTLGLREGRVARMDASYLPSTTRADLVGWLKAVEAMGGFHPPAPSRP